MRSFLHSFCEIKFATIGLVFALGLSSCTNIGKLGGSLQNGDAGFFNDGSLGAGGSFVLLTVLPSQAQGYSGNYDLVGEGSQFATFCPNEAACQCVFEYSQNNVGTQTFDSAVTYTEANLLRCSVPGQIAAVPQFTVKVKTSDGANFSNTITVNLNNGSFSNSTFFLDLSLPESFLNVSRFQCRQLIDVPSMFDQNAIDPIQSEDPRILYPFNFYTTNPADSLLQLQQTGNQRWQCTLTATQDRRVHWWANPNVFSASDCATVNDPFCAGDQDRIYPINSLTSGPISIQATPPPNAGKVRSSFALAKQAYGVFQVPVIAAVAPNSYVSPLYASGNGIGFAAKAIPNGSTSSCPNITLPPNSAWVKLWNFRATNVTAPQYVVSASAVGNASNPRKILCDSGPNVFPGCDFNANGSNNCGVMPDGTGRFACGQLTETGTRMTRLIELIGNGASQGMLSCHNIQKSSWTGTSDLTAETWIASPFGYGIYDPPPTSSTIASFPWGMFSNVTTINGTGATASLSPVPTAATPSDPSFQTSAINATAQNTLGDNFTDNLFVVTPVTVDDQALKNQSPALSHYTPVTYRTTSACNPGPNQTMEQAIAAGQCDQSMRIQWDINVGQVNDTNAVNPVYPLCVLQFFE